LPTFARRSGPADRSSTIEPQPIPAFATKLPVDAPGAPGMAGAEALFRKWSARWQEF
jgi:hypothetical protein